MGTYFLAKWLHIVAMAYWLGGEWGVFNSSRYVVDPKLSFGERMRHMETAFRIDVLARAGIIMLLPLGLHLGNILGVQPLGGAWLTGMWLLVAGWMALMLAAFRHRGTELGIRLTRIDESIRYVVIPSLFLVATISLVTGRPIVAKWYATKMFIFGGLLIIGLYLRWVMREWFFEFRRIEAAGGDAQAEARLGHTMQRARIVAYFYWVLIGTMAYLGVAKPF